VTSIFHAKAVAQKYKQLFKTDRFWRKEYNKIDFAIFGFFRILYKFCKALDLVETKPR
jgi:hypothetical protein